MGSRRSATPGAIIAQTTAPRSRPQPTATVLLLGFPGRADGEDISPKHLPPPANYAKHALHQRVAGCADARRAGQRRQDDYRPSATGTASIYVPLPINTYTVKFVDPVTGTVSPVLVGVALNQGVYTVYAVGADSSMTAIYSIDR